jgi:hypothetical protein
MSYKYIKIVVILWMTTWIHLSAQNSICNPVSIDSSEYQGTAYFNFGSIAKSKSQKYQTAVSIGQNFVGFTDNNSNSSYLGFYGRYLLPPFAVNVNATQGDLLDRIQLSWTVDGLGPSPNEGFNIYRDGIFLATVGSNIRNYNDFNVIAGVAYTYSVRGINFYGEGAPSYALGFQVPNGVVTGWIKTKSGSPVPNAVVTLMPMQGFSAKFEAMDQAIASVESPNKFLPTNQNWSMTFWLKTDSASMDANVISLGEILLYIRAKNSGSGQEGIEIAKLPNGAPLLNATFADSIKNEWNHIAISFEDAVGTMRIYINGELKDQSFFNDNVTMGEGATTEVFLKMGNPGDAGGWNGNVDELRIYNILLNELDIPEIMHGTASSLTDGLTHYWKMDEELGEKSYDLKNRVKLFFCGAKFDADRPPVRTAGKTNNQGYYRIESASYGTGTTFLAEPEKNFYLQKSVKLTSSQSSNIVIPNFGLPQKSTIELWANSTGSTGIQTILSKKSDINDFRVFLEPMGIEQQLKMTLNGDTHTFGILGSGFQHLAITIDSLSNAVQIFKNGVSIGTHTFSGAMGNLAEGASPWRLGTHDNGSILTDYFNGLIDEFAVYDTILSQPQITSHYQETRNIQEKGLYVYFPMNEGAGNRISNVGSHFLSFGTLIQSDWSSFAPNQIEQPHVFTPKTRQVTLNPSVTSVDQVDFTDNSTIPVSGFVRYIDTDCFAPNIEILVNDASYNPRIFTDSLGKFVVDFDPGFTGTLRPKFEDHSFLPAFWQVTNISGPIAGVLFNDQTTRTISGQLAGGYCRRSILDTDEVATVIVSSVNGCYRKIYPINNQEGTFIIPNQPPLEKMTVAVKHPDPIKDKALNDAGFPTVNVSKRDTTLEFLYFVEPEIELSGLVSDYPSCNVLVMEQYEFKEVTIRLKEQYTATPSNNGVCYIDTANVRIINGFADETKDTTLSKVNNGILLYKYRVGSPNPSPPYLKTLQIVSTTLDDNSGTIVRQGIVTGIFNKLPSFTTQLPETPTMVLHDPPGDGSYAFIEQGQKICQTMSFDLELEGGQSIKNSFDFGIDTEITPFFGVPAIKFETEVGPSLTIATSITKSSSNSLDVCNTLNQKLSTSEDELVVGVQGGDVFMGGGLNINFSRADIVYFDSTTCNAFDTLSIAIQPGQYGTTFMYSEFYIKNTVIPNLNILKSETTDPEAINRFQNSINRWNTIISDNNRRKEKAKVSKNISFDAGVSYEYAETIDTVTTESSSIGNNTNFDQELTTKVKVNGIGPGIELKTSIKSVTSKSESKNKERGVTTGYVFKDNDVLDAFSVDIGIDSMYKTPTFKIKAGQSSCPWEPGTANRERPNLQIAEGSQFTAVDVPANEAAVFQLRLGNLSATNEDWTYGFTSIAANNPHGAIIKLNGQPLNYTQKYIVPYGTSQLVTLTVEKGPVEYKYDSLLVAMYSECEYERNLALSLPLANDTMFFSPMYLSAYFIRPCSEVVINDPEQNFVIFPDPETPDPDIIKHITISGYNTDPNFKEVRMQYRKANSDGTWKKISEKYNPFWAGRDTLTGAYDTLDQRKYDIFEWDTDEFVDGEYEIRAVAVCTGDAFDKPGYSEIIKGKIDRSPPAIFGVPQPSDGVYHVGDEISFTFNQEIDCRDFMNGFNRAKLVNTETNDEISIVKSCVNNKIILTPDFINAPLENKILRAELHNIKDLTGNNNSYEKWEFYVDRNELAWLSDSIEIVKFVDETKTISAKIHNRGGYPVPYIIDSIPDWLHVFPDRGTLVANEIEEIFFTVKDDMDLGEEIKDIVLITQTGINPFFMGGTEPLNIKARNLCRPETWVLNPAGLNVADYNFSMNFIVQLNIEGTLSLDENDIVGAYVDGQLRGIAKIEYQPSINKYLAFLTVYSNLSAGETIKFQIWDASDCKLYAYALETFIFEANDIKGTINSAIILHTNTTLLRKIFLNPGWNWISMNLDLTPNTTNEALSSLSNPVGAYIKSQGPFSNYSAPLNIWLGSLTTLEPENMYQYKSVVKDSLSIIGNYVDPALTPIALDSGWNWIGYLPTQSLKVNDALSSINATNGDIIKSQLHFAQYLDGTGWVGNLKAMNAPNGYLLSLKADDTLLYPDPLNFKDDKDGDIRNLILPEYHGLTEISAIPPLQLPFAHWQVQPNKYEHNMNAIAIVVESGAETNFLQDGDEVAAFVNNEVRGSAKAIYIPQLRSYLIFMTIYANKEGELMTLKFYDASTNQEYDLIEKIDFKVNHIIGLVDNPTPWHLSTTTSANDLIASEGISVYPNPFTTSLYVNYALKKNQDVKLNIKDVLGKLIDVKIIASKAGINQYEWIPTDIIGGTYFITLESEEGVYSHKVLYIK